MVELTGVEPVSEKKSVRVISGRSVFIKFPLVWASTHALHLGSFISSCRAAKLKPVHVQYLIDALTPCGTNTGRTAAPN